MMLQNAAYPLHVLALALQRVGLGNAVLVGNMGAAVQGANVMTEDFDFLVPPVRDLPARIRHLAEVLDAQVMPPDRPYGTWYLRMRETEWRIDLLLRMSGISSYRALRTRAKEYPTLDGLVVASLRDIITSKRAAGRAKDYAVLPELEATLHAIQKSPRRRLRRR